MIFKNQNDVEKNILDLDLKKFIQIGDKIDFDFSSVYFIAEFEITHINTEYKILGNFSKYIFNEIKEIIIDNNKIPIIDSYMFPTIGKHIVKYKFKKENIIPAGFLNGCNEVIGICIPNYITDILVSSFVGCNLKYVKIFNSKIINFNNEKKAPFIMPSFLNISNSCKFYLRRNLPCFRNYEPIKNCNFQ